MELAKARASAFGARTVTGVTAIIKQELAKAFDSATMGRPNTPATVAWKLFAYGGVGRPLVGSGALSRAVKNPEILATITPTHNHIEITFDFPEAGQAVAYEGQKRANPNYSYVWSHEYGATGSRMFKFGIKEWGNFSVPARPFLQKGISEGMKRSRLFATNEFVSFSADMKKMFSPTFKMETGINMQREFHITTADVMMTLLPPSAMYAMLGGGMDYFNMLSGEFGMDNVGQWMMQMGKGTIGATKLTQRRKLRKWLWSHG